MISTIKKWIQEFKPSLIFLAKFLLAYTVLTFIYSIYLKSFDRSPDIATRWVTSQTAFLLDTFIAESHSSPNSNKPTVSLFFENVLSVSIYEGCNGINMIIVFIAFIVSFNNDWRNMVWFIPVGILFIHFSNLLRLIALALISNRLPDYFYFFHKYLFTAIIFIAIFILWYIWVVKVKHQKLIPNET